MSDPAPQTMTEKIQADIEERELQAQTLVEQERQADLFKGLLTFDSRTQSRKAAHLGQKSKALAKRRAAQKRARRAH